MKKSKYGEDTVVMRVPRSMVSQVKAMLAGAEVLSVTKKTPRRDTPISRFLSEYPDEFIHEALIKAYRLGFSVGEETLLFDQLELACAPDLIPLALDAFRQKPSLAQSKKAVEVFAKAYLKVAHKVPLNWHELVGSRADGPILIPVEEFKKMVVSSEDNAGEI
jgi:hypothetical protein